jgi:hypothetical protein
VNAAVPHADFGAQAGRIIDTYDDIAYHRKFLPRLHFRGVIGEVVGGQPGPGEARAGRYALRDGHVQKLAARRDGAREIPFCVRKHIPHVSEDIKCRCRSGLRREQPCAPHKARSAPPAAFLPRHRKLVGAKTS